MKYLMSAEWWKAAGIRAAKTMFQTGAALVVTQMPGGTVDWMAVGQCSNRGGCCVPRYQPCRSARNWRKGIRLNGILGMDGV